MQQFFDDIVRAFQATCRATGLTYPELNILVYCLLAPLSWLLVVVLRRPRLWWLPLGLLLAAAGLLMERQRYRGLSRWFYDYNIRVLELVGHYTGLGYVAVSLLVGVLVPTTALLLLLLVPKRWALPLAGTFVALLLAYFVLGRMLTWTASPRMKRKLREWLRRYLPAEILSLLATVMGAALALRLTGSRLTAAWVGTWAGNVFYFGTILLTDVWRARQQRREAGLRYTACTFGRNVRALVVEFGVAELADTFLIRPALMYYLPLWLGRFSLGILLAKLAADVTFYVPAIIGYELSKKRLRDFR